MLAVKDTGRDMEQESLVMGSLRWQVSMSSGTDVLPREIQNFWDKFTGLTDTNSVDLGHIMIMWKEVGEGKGGLNGDGRRLNLGW